MNDLKRKRFKQNLRNYKRRFTTALTLCFLLISILFIISFERIFYAIEGFRSIQKIIETKFFNFKEELEFKEGVFSIKIPKDDKIIDLKAEILQNKSTAISINRVIPYQMRSFKAEALRFKVGEKIFEDAIFIKSDFAEQVDESFKIYENVDGVYKSRLNPKLDGAVFFADEITFFSNLNAKGVNLFIKSKEGNFSAKIFTILKAEDVGFFESGVMTENNDYKINSQNLKARMLNGEISDLLFTKNVVFRQKNEERTIVNGDNAFYDNLKSEITIYGNVTASSTKNSFNAKGESFHYNVITKVGYLKQNPKDMKRVEIELEI